MSDEDNEERSGAVSAARASCAPICCKLTRGASEGAADVAGAVSCAEEAAAVLVADAADEGRLEEDAFDEEAALTTTSWYTRSRAPTT